MRIACCGSGVTWIAGSPSPAQYGRRRCRPVAARLRLPGSVCPVARRAGGFNLAWLIMGGASARLLGLKVCVCGPRAPISRLPGGAATAASRVGGASYDGCLQWRPCHCGVGCVCVATPWLVREPRGWGFRGCGGGGWGAGVWWAGSRAQARGQLATVRHAHRVSTQLKPTQQASGLFFASVARKPSPALTQLAGGVCKQPAQPVANEDAEHARFSDSRLLSRGRANCWKSVH